MSSSETQNVILIENDKKTLGTIKLLDKSTVHKSYNSNESFMNS